MAVTPAEELEFDEDDLAPAVAVLAEVTAAGGGWVNLSPEVEPGHDPPPRNVVVAVFSARGAAIPLATFSAPEQPGGRATIGIEHGAGPRALERLAEHDLVLGPGWLKVADHPRRGLVVTVPPGAATADVLWWLLAASHALSPVPLTGAWLAKVYRP
ncbi:MAG TPA: hypothetical protein VHK88_18315 [Aquihabitans sp.]|jgi:hypothetical protein|nr:hypothetical protein [Aquihabitans sp.]